MKRIMLTAAVAGIAIDVSSFAVGQPPADNGAELLEQRCSECHASTRAKKAEKTREQWEATVLRMMDKGAKLSEAEKKTLVDYLSATYKP